MSSSNYMTFSDQSTSTAFDIPWAIYERWAIYEPCYWQKNMEWVSTKTYSEFEQTHFINSFHFKAGRKVDKNFQIYPLKCKNIKIRNNIMNLFKFPVWNIRCILALPYSWISFFKFTTVAWNIIIMAARVLQIIYCAKSQNNIFWWFHMNFSTLQNVALTV